jgi:hypothetical protein
MRFLPALRRTQDVDEFDRDNQIDYTLDEWMSYLNELVYNGNTYFTQSPPQTQPGQRQEPIGPAYRSLTDLAYKTDSVVFSCMLTRAQHFSEVRFQFRQMNNPGFAAARGTLGRRHNRGSVDEDDHARRPWRQRLRGQAR